MEKSFAHGNPGQGTASTVSQRLDPSKEPRHLQSWGAGQRLLGFWEKSSLRAAGVHLVRETVLKSTVW